MNKNIASRMCLLLTIVQGSMGMAGPEVDVNAPTGFWQLLGGLSAQWELYSGLSSILNIDVWYDDIFMRTLIERRPVTCVIKGMITSDHVLSETQRAAKVIPSSEVEGIAVLILQAMQQRDSTRGQMPFGSGLRLWLEAKEMYQGERP